MEFIKPERLKDLDPQRRTALITRSMEDISGIYEQTRAIVQSIQRDGDAVTLKHYQKNKSDITLRDLQVQPEEVKSAYQQVEKDVVQALKAASKNIEKFHRAQVERDMWTVEIREGILAGRITRPLDSVGAYVPGGQANYPSSVLMNIIPAKVAGVKTVVACTPPKKGQVADPVTIVAADIAGADYLFKIGGPWAIAGLAYGTGIMPKVDKIVGPGNKYVTAAKMAVFGIVNIDSPAGPSEALIVADETARSEWVVWDFLSQIEHDPDAGAVLVTPSFRLAEEVCKIINRELPKLERKEIIEEALTRHSAILVTSHLKEAVDFANEYAAEHLQIVTEDPWIILPQIKHAGSIFMGAYAPVPAGDYASGTNHVLPTGGCARMFSGLSVDDFIKKPTFQYLSRKGLKGLKDTITLLARKEGLPLHAKTIEVRFE
jgi:histidinol dehydrogenase